MLLIVRDVKMNTKEDTFDYCLAVMYLDNLVINSNKRHTLTMSISLG